MSVSSISSGEGLNQVDWRSTAKQGKQDFSQLLGALQSGDLSGAQQAFASMQQLLAAGFQTSTLASANSGTSASSGSTAAGTIAGTVGTDFSALGTALNSGSLSGAQNAVAKLQQDSQAYRQGHHQFGNLEHAEEVYKSMQISSGSVNSSNQVTTSGPTNSLNSDLAALGQALQSGSMSSAQDAFAKFQQDLQSTQQGPGSGHHHHRHNSASGTQNPISSYIANSAFGSSASTASSSSVTVSA